MLTMLMADLARAAEMLKQIEGRVVHGASMQAGTDPANLGGAFMAMFGNGQQRGQRR